MKNSEMVLIIVLRLVSVFCLIYFAVLIYLRGGADFQWIWLMVGVMSGILSVKVVEKWFFSNKWLNIFMIIGVCFFVVVEMMILVGSVDSKASEDKDFLIVLGAGVRGTVPSLILRNRLDKAHEYLTQHPSTRVIVTGGQGKGEDITEALAMKSYLVDKGISVERLIMEDQATNTLENMAYSFEIIDELKTDASITVVTTRFHLFRSKLIAKGLEKEVSGLGAKNYWPLIPNYYVREFFAVMKELVH